MVETLSYVSKLILLSLLPSPAASVAKGLRVSLETSFSIPAATLQAMITAPWD